MPGLHIDRWIAGLHTNRSPIATPFRSAYGHVIQYKDALIDGLNVEITPANTLGRRPGWTKYSTATYSGTANGLFGADLNATLHALLSTTTNVYDIGTGSMTSIYSKGTTAQTFFQQIGNLLYMSDGNSNLKWDGTTNTNNLTNNGIATPPNAPTVTNLNLYDTVGSKQNTHAWVPGAVYSNTTGTQQTYYIEVPTGEMYFFILPAGTTLTSQSSAPNWAAKFGTIGATVVDGQITWTNSGTILSWEPSAGSNTYFNSAFTSPGTYSATAKPGTVLATGSSGVNWSVGAPGLAHTANGTGNVTSNVLTLRNFGFAIPASAVVTGIKVQFDANSSESGATTDDNIQLLAAAGAVGTGKAQGQWFYSKNNSAFATRTYGSNTDGWGAGLLYSDVNASTFGFEVVFNGAYGSFLVGTVLENAIVTVYYTVGTWTGAYTASVILDSNNNLQRVKTLGTTGGSAPAWATTVGATTTDNTMTWECLGSGNVLPCLFSWTYAYGFRTTTAHISTMSPLLTLLSPIIGPSVGVTGFGSNDAQCTTVEVYRTPDGGSLLLLDQSVPNVNASTAWTIADTLVDTLLNVTIIGPVAHANDPAPVGMTILAEYQGRMWGIVGNFLYFSAGPDCINGDGFQAWPPANVFALAAPGTGLAATTQGLLVMTGITIDAILGGPQLNTYWRQPLFKNIGVQSPNCVTQDGDTTLMFTSQQQAVSLSASGKNEFGFDIAPTLAANFPAGTSYIVSHRAGQDQGIFMSDGSTNQQRFNMNAECWDPIGTPANGIGPMASVDTAIGTRRLLSAAGGYVLFRDVATYSDAGTAYAAYATVGSLVLSEAGEKAMSVNSLLLQSNAVGAALAISVLPNEISGAFTSIPLSNSDPWQLPASSTINMKAYQWKGVQSFLPDLLRHVQVKITLPATDTVKNEIYTLSLV